MPEKSTYLMRRAVRGAKRHINRLSLYHYPNYDRDIRGFRRPEEAATRELARADILAKKEDYYSRVNSFWALTNAFHMSLKIPDEETKSKYLIASQRRLKKIIPKLGYWDRIKNSIYSNEARYYAETIIPAHIPKDEAA